MKILYYECFAGISGDMNLAAFIDLGVPTDYLNDQLSKLNIEGYQIKVENALKHGISGTKVTVELKNNKTAHTHGHGHGHGSGSNHHHRTFANIKGLILQTTLSEKVKADSIGIFQLIANAEGKIHNKPPDDVHFHEVGAIDSIVDIVGAAICMEYINPDKVLSTPIELGSGFVFCAHGKFPVPAPATMEILHNVPVVKGTVGKEATTPTGAAILKYYVNEFNQSVSITPQKTAYGIGHLDFEIPNVLRLSLAEDGSGSNWNQSTAIMLECNIDDMPAEHTEFVTSELFEAGAHDVFYTPIIMKKGRLANQISVLCHQEKANAIKAVLFEQTPTIGLRQYTVEKTFLPREIITVETKYGPINIKHCQWEGHSKFKPEFEECRLAAKKHNIPVWKVIEEARHVFKNLNNG